MKNWLSRTELLIGHEVLAAFSRIRVAIIGLGGVGGPVAEALCRAGIENFLLMDNDYIEPTNLNRQIFATLGTIGQKKCNVAKSRLESINPHVVCEAKDIFYLPETRHEVFSYSPHIIIDAIDTVTAKLDLIETATTIGIPIISSMGTGNRLHPEMLQTGFIEDTVGYGCGLARVMRRELKKRNISGVRVLYSREQPQKISFSPDSPKGRHSPGSISFVPPVAGYMIAAEVMRMITECDV